MSTNTIAAINATANSNVSELNDSDLTGIQGGAQAGIGPENRYKTPYDSSPEQLKEWHDKGWMDCKSYATYLNGRKPA